MKTLTVTEFKAEFGRLAKARIPVLVRNHKVLLGVWQPWGLRQLKAKQADVLKGFVNLGRSAHRDIARRHDKYLYGKSSHQS
jgi:hypothetical protein